MSKSQEITLTGGYWGTMYGFRISKGDRDRLFRPLKSRLNREKIIIESPSGKSPRLSLSLKVTPSFWDNCHEFRSHEIGAWMEKQGDAPWCKGDPSKYSAKLSTAGAGPIKIKILRKK